MADFRAAMMGRMVPGAYREARWLRSEPGSTFSVPMLERLAQFAFPACRLLHAQLLAGGLRNANVKLQLDGVPEAVVLRIFEHDPLLCQKEVDLYHLVHRWLPVPELIYAQTGGQPTVPPFTVNRYVEGITFLDLKRSGDAKGIAEAAYSAGETLAAMGRIQFAEPGWITAGLSVSGPLLNGSHSIPRFVDCCLASAIVQSRLPADLVAATRRVMQWWAPRVAQLEQASSLVHGDFNRRNLLVRQVDGRWEIAAVLDWEFAISGSPLGDVASFLRYETAERPVAEPSFSFGYVEAGGTLPGDWRQLAWLLDLAAMAESLTRDELPANVISELIELIRLQTSRLT